MTVLILSQIAQVFEISEVEAKRLLETAPKRYKTYAVPKRSGVGYRTIAQPAREIKMLQRWAVQEYLATLPVHSAAQAYEVGSSIKNNADWHK